MGAIFGAYIGFLVVFGIVLFVVSILFAHFAGKCAETRGREYGMWFIGAFLLSPIWVIIVLLCLGETNERRKERILEEEKWKMDLLAKTEK